MSEAIQPTNGQDTRGRFVRGNRLGRGNPLSGRAAKIRAVLLQKLTPKDAGEIADKLIQQAKGGDIAAINAILDRTIGKAVQPIEGDAPQTTFTLNIGGAIHSRALPDGVPRAPQGGMDG